MERRKERFFDKNAETSRKASEQKLEELDDDIGLSKKLCDGGYAKLGGSDEYKSDLHKIVINFSANKSLGVKVDVLHVHVLMLS